MWKILRNPRRLVGLLCVALAAFGSTAGAAVAAPTARTYHIDCAEGDDRNPGTTPLRPLRSLGRLNEITFAPGDSVLFRAGTRCAGTFRPKGSGEPGRPITVTGYGQGAKPVLDGQGGQAAVHLVDVRWWELRELAVTNWGPAPALGQQRAGVYVSATDQGTVEHFVFTGLDIRDVNGCDCRFPPSGGIVFLAGGSTTKTAFHDVVLTGNTIDRVDRMGIGILSTWLGAPLVPMTGVAIVGNRITDVGGEGVAAFNGRGARIERNTIDRFNQRSPEYNAGAYAWNAENTRFAYNNVSGGKGTAMAFSLDDANVGTVFEYNLSRDNKGGFLFVCSGDTVASANGTVRYNISQNDAAGDDPPATSMINIACGPSTNTNIHNNTFYAPNTARLVENTSTGGTGPRVSNNIFVGRAGGSTITDPYGVYRNNLYLNVTAPPADDRGALGGDPRFVAPGRATTPDNAAGYALCQGSPALNRGVPVPGTPRRDFFGNPVHPVRPNLSAYDGPGQRCS